MEACKCDLCGHFYDLSNNMPKYWVTKYALGNRETYDLCPVCQEKLQEFLGVKKTEPVSEE